MLRTLFLSGRISFRATAAAVTTSGLALVGLNVPIQRLSFSSGNANLTTPSDNASPRVAGQVVTAEEKAANDAIWEEKANSCPLCRLFLDSPCAEEFKMFSDCADRAKESGEEVASMCGSSDFAKMRQCMELYPEHFEMLFEAEEGIVADDEEDFEEAPGTTSTPPSSSQDTTS